MQKKGFTLVEVVMAIVIIAILAAVAVPALLGAQRRAKEANTIGTLRIIGNAQLIFREQAAVDQDGDDLGEYGLLGELTCNVTIRGLPTNPDKTYVSHMLAPEAGKNYAVKDGYCYKMYLPGDAAVVTDDGTTNPISISANANYQEHRFRCYAWPVSPGSFGTLVFATNNICNIYQADNTNSTDGYRYSGDLNAPAYNAASPAGDTIQFTKEFEGGTGNDGQTWYIVTK